MTTNGRALSGRTMLVTGAAKRLGRAIALAAAENGADVAITYRESGREGRGGGRGVCGGRGRKRGRSVFFFRRGGGREARAVVGELAQHGVEALAVRCDVT